MSIVHPIAVTACLAFTLADSSPASAADGPRTADTAFLRSLRDFRQEYASILSRDSILPALDMGITQLGLRNVGEPPPAAPHKMVAARPRSARAAERAPELPRSRSIIGAQRSMPRAVIDEGLVEQRARLQFCYQRWLEQDPNLAGKVMLEFVVHPKGRVSHARVVESSVGNDAVGRCMVRVIESTAFQPPLGVRATAVRQTFFVAAE